MDIYKVRILVDKMSLFSDSVFQVPTCCSCHIMGYSYVYPPLGGKAEGKSGASGPDLTRETSPRPKKSPFPDVNPQRDIQSFMSTLKQQIPIQKRRFGGIRIGEIAKNQKSAQKDPKTAAHKTGKPADTAHLGPGNSGAQNLGRQEETHYNSTATATTSGITSKSERSTAAKIFSVAKDATSIHGPIGRQSQVRIDRPRRRQTQRGSGDGRRSRLSQLRLSSNYRLFPKV